MKNPQEEAIRRMVERLSDTERDDLSAKINNAMFADAMKYKVGDKVKIKSLDWFNDNKYNRKHFANFSDAMSDYCGQEATITKISTNKTYYELDIDNNVFCWGDWMFEDDSEQEQADSNSLLEVPAMLADPSIPDRYKWGGRINEAFLDGVEYAERILTNQAKEQNDWRSVKDELPEFGERVLIVSFFPSGHRDMRVANMFQCRNEETGEETTSWTNPVRNETITHWMPLPEPPKTEKQ